MSLYSILLCCDREDDDSLSAQSYYSIHMYYIYYIIL